MSVIRQSTQVVRLIGPFLDKTDGVTEEAGLAATATEISKEGAAFGAGPVLGTLDSDGWYPVTLTTTHTNTIGELVIKVHDAATHLPVFAKFQVIEEAAYDAIYATSAAPATTTNITAGTVTTATNVTTVNGLAANVITAAATAADFGTEVAAAIWDRDATLSQTQGTFGQAIGDPVADTNTIFKAVVTDATGATVGVDVVAVKAETAAILTDTAEIGAAGAGLTVLATQASVNTIDDFLDTEIAAILAAVDTEVAAIKAVTDLLPDAGALTSLATAAALDTIDNFLDTEVAAILADTNELQTDFVDGGRLDLLIDAIKAKTDSLTFTVANQVDVNAQSINDVTLVGDGSVTPWGPV